MVLSSLDYYVLVQMILKIHDHFKTAFTVTEQWGALDLHYLLYHHLLLLFNRIVTIER